MSSSKVWFASFCIKDKKMFDEFFSYLGGNQVTYEKRQQNGFDVDLIIWEPIESCFWDDVEKYCTQISASEYEETGENINIGGEDDG